LAGTKFWGGTAAAAGLLLNDIHLSSSFVKSHHRRFISFSVKSICQNTSTTAWHTAVTFLSHCRTAT